VRDGAVMRATHDYLRTQRSGQVSAELTILTVDLETRSLVISRNSQCPVFLLEPLQADGSADEVGEPAWLSLDDPATTVGVHTRARPVIAERPMAGGQVVAAFTDGVLHAGERRPHPLNVRSLLTHLPVTRSGSAQQLADAILDAAVAADAGRPGDDTTVVVLKVTEAGDEDQLAIRRMTVSFPVPPG
jgi:serine phosphatase RsbU (regulator of sigma subunit)